MDSSTFDLSKPAPQDASSTVSAAPGPETIVQGGYSPYHSPAALGKAAVILLSVFGVLWMLVMFLQLPDAMGHKNSDAAVILLGLIAMMGLLGLLSTAIVFLVWYHRCYSNLPALGARDLMATPGWSVGWFFVPIASLFRPYQTTVEMWRASDPDVLATDANSREQLPLWNVIPWWWGLWIAGEVFERLTNDTPHGIGGAAQVTVLILSGVTWGCASILAIKVVKSITERQELKYRRLTGRA